MKTFKKIKRPKFIEDESLKLQDICSPEVHKDMEYFIKYIQTVLCPAGEEFFEKVNKNVVRLHDVYAFNAIQAHAIDYQFRLMQVIDKHLGSGKKIFNASRRGDVIKEFDEKYSVEGSEHINYKFQLLDSVNNSFKHVVLNKEWYSKLIERYGELSFHCLQHDNGKIFFDTGKYKFDYCRVVLRPIYNIYDCGLSSESKVLKFIQGNLFGALGYGVFPYSYEPHEAIDRMIDNCSAVCMDCGESDGCDCPNFIYGDNSGSFNPDVDPLFEFDDVMSQISGTREWRR